jgi:hypothetical protein
MSARQHHATLGRFDQVGNRPVAGIVAAEGIGDADDGPAEGVVGIAHGLDEGLSQEQREAVVSISGELRAHAGGRTRGLSHCIVVFVHNGASRCLRDYGIGRNGNAG